jgi:hypothetical protein
MPSKGNPKITVRATPEFIEEIEREVNSNVLYKLRGAKTITEFVLAAIAEKLAHLKRSRKSREPKAPPPPDTSAAL